MNDKIIAVDFDGTLSSNQWPNIGEPNKKLFSYLIDEQKKGSKIILWTCREGRIQKEAVDWCATNGLIFDAVNKNVDEMIAAYGHDSRKIFANIYIDDLNCRDDFDLPF